LVDTRAGLLSLYRREEIAVYATGQLPAESLRSKIWRFSLMEQQRAFNPLAARFAPPRGILSALLVVACAWLAASPAAGDVVKTVEGREIEGRIIAENADGVKIETTGSGIVYLRRDRIESVRRSEIGTKEAAGDRAVVRQDYYEALRLYQAARDEGKASAQLDRKTADAKKIIEEQERALYQSLFQQGADLSKRGQHGEARDVFQKILASAKPETLAARRAHRAIACEYLLENFEYQNMVRYMDAMSVLEKAVKEDPDLVVAQFELARLYRGFSNNTQRAVSQYEKAVLIAQALSKEAEEELKGVEPPEARLTDEKIARCHFDLAELYLSLGQKQKAADTFQSLLEGNTKGVPASMMNEVIHRIGEVLTDIDPNMKLDKAKTIQGLDTALKYNPNLSKAWFLKGRLSLEDGATSQALLAFEKAAATAAKLGESLPESFYLFRGRAYLQENRLDLAKENLLKALEKNDTYDLRCVLGDVLVQGMQYEEGLKQFRVAIGMEPDLFPALLGSARVYRLQALARGVSETAKQDLRNQARTCIEKVLAKNDKYPEAVLEKGRLLKDEERFDDALMYLTLVIETFKDADPAAFSRQEKSLLASAYAERGEVQLKKVNWNLAEADFQKALKTKPDFARAYNLLGDAAMKVGRTAQAEEHYKKAISLDPANADFEVSLGILYQEMKRYSEAIERYLKHQQKGGSDLRVQNWIRECNDGLGGRAK